MLCRSEHGLGNLLKKTLPCRTSPQSQSLLFNSHLPFLHHASLASRRCYASSPSPEYEHDIAVLGGGITGLASAYYLTQQLPKAKITIYEAGERIGGWLASKRVPVSGGSILFEGGPRTLRPVGNGVLAGRLIQELGLAGETIFTQKSAPAATNRYLYHPDQLVRMPHPSFGFFTNVWNIVSNPTLRYLPLAAIKEPFVAAPEPRAADESLGTFFSRRLGEDLVTNVLSGVIHGIYAGDVWRLSAKSLFPTPWRWEGSEGSLYAGFLKNQAEGGAVVTKHEGEFLKMMSEFPWDKRLAVTLRDNSVFTFREGLGQLAERLYEQLWASGRVEFKRSTPVVSLALERSEGGKESGVRVSSTAKGETEQQRTHSHAISALSPAHLNATTSIPIVPEMETVTVMTVNLYYRSADLHPPGFGYLIPAGTPFEQNPERALGVVFDTGYSPDPSEATTNPAPLDEQGKPSVDTAPDGFYWHDTTRPLPRQDDLSAGTRGSKMTVMLGGHWWDGWPSFPSESEGLQLARSLLQRHLNISEEPEAWSVNLQRDCIPQYTVGHEQRLKTARGNLSKLFEGRVKVAGNWMQGVGVNDCLRSAWEAAEAVRKGDRGTGLEFVGETEMVKVARKAKGKGGGE